MSGSDKCYGENQGKERGQYHVMAEVGAVLSVRQPQKTALRRGHMGK